LWTKQDQLNPTVEAHAGWPLELRIIENIRLLTAADVDLLNVVVGQDLGDC
jgi:hypothetical protein